MADTRTYLVDASADRLDRFLSARSTDLSRARVQRLIAEGYVAVDGSPAKPASSVRPGQTVVLTMPPPTRSDLPPQDIPLDVVYQDDCLLVVDKPAGLTVHPGPGHRDQTLVNALLAICPDLYRMGGTSRPGIVHRLDKDTSGLMVVAKHEKAHADLGRQLRERQFEKRYVALVHGRLSRSEAVVQASIGRDPANRKRMAVVSRGREAETRYRVLKRYGGLTLVEVRPTTGRTHQIRVHFAALGHPLVGDATYGKPNPRLGRHFLHASLLGFRMPCSEEYVEFTSQLPGELQRFLGGLDPEA